MKFKPLPIGIDNFEMLITRKYNYVDKTLLIKDLLDNKAAVNLFTRPRRFGKTLNMSMLQYFFETSEKNNSYLFENLNIMNAGEEYLSHMGKYPVINLTLKSGKQATFKMAYECMIDEISKEYSRHIYILDGEKLLDSEKETFLNIVKKKAKESDYAKALQFLSNCLEKYHDNKVIILIDEYDVPLENAFFEGFYKEIITFLRSLFESALKTNSSLEFSVITGCLRISKESIFTGLNNLNIISILNDRYAEYFGFSDNEVKELTKYYELEEKYPLIRDWYNGYVFGHSNVYNPWSVIKFFFDLLANKNVFPSSYWANTSSNSIVKSLIEKADSQAKQEIELLIEGKTIEKPVHEDITYDEIYDTMDNLWNFMFFTGYFKKVNERIDETNQKYVELKIPNEEVKYIFRTKVLKWFENKVKAKDLSVLYSAIINGNSETFEVELGRLLMETISFNDAYENFYHGFVVGALANMHDYIVKSNREGGKGRSDLFIKSVSKRGVAIVIEFKIAKYIDDLEKRADDALKQIEEKGYDMELRSEGYKNIIRYGISFYEKDCYIKMNKETKILN
ncbi:AAA family ATPase [Clostridium sp.]|uniref:AAA family ATPase n=1 Tax=Clostridium sp. TaxID=1506 RepID=UPI00261C0AAF|nr:AAA family ATPase [Clostridium sp.]